MSFELLPNSPQAKYELKRIKEVLIEIEKETEKTVTLDEAALRLWRASRETREVKGRPWV